MIGANGSGPVRQIQAGHARRLPPGPRELPILGSALLAVDPLGNLLHVARTYGDVARFHLLGVQMYLVSHPDAIEQVLLTEPEHTYKDVFTRELSIMLGQGILTSGGSFWRRQRRLVQPGFQHKRVQAHGEVMVRAAEALVRRLRDGERRDLHADFLRLALDIIAELLFGREIEYAADTIADGLATFLDRFEGAGPLIPYSVPIPRHLRMRRARKRMDELVYGLIRTRRSESDRGDLLSMLLRATTEEGVALSDEQLRDELMTLLMAGHETTALVLSYTFYLLGRHPRVEERLLAELREVLGDRPVTAADLPRLSYADAVVREALRVYPPAWVIGREAVVRGRIAGYDVEPGTQVWMSPWVVHRDPRYFPEPEAFRPERWLDPAVKNLPRYAYFPFGGGPRVCIGGGFALTQISLVLATLLRHVRFVPERGSLKLLTAITLRPKHGMRGFVYSRSRM